MKKRKMLKNEKGFTLIEIIAVIIIMGILAAVAVPKFFSMQDDAKKAAVNGALSEAAARFNHAFSKYILDVKKAPADVAVLKDPLYLGIRYISSEFCKEIHFTGILHLAPAKLDHVCKDLFRLLLSAQFLQAHCLVIKILVINVLAGRCHLVKLLC